LRLRWVRSFFPIILFLQIVDIKVGSSVVKHTYSSSKITENFRRSLPTTNVKRDSENKFINAYLERATLCTYPLFLL
jgi:hypothetical protein